MANTLKMFNSMEIREQVLSNAHSFSDQVSGNQYTLLPNLIGEGGEAQLYEATEILTGRKCVAKIDVSGILGDLTRRKHWEGIVSVLRAHQNYHEHHLLPLLAAGALKAQWSDAFLGERAVEIYPFASSGNFADVKLPYAVLRDDVVPALATAIDTLHGSGFLHRDIKPENLLRFDSCFVLSDFSTAVPIGQENRDVFITATVRRTVGYSAPEVNFQYASRACDYFSLGLTLASLYYGGHPLKEAFKCGGDIAFYRITDSAGFDGLGLTFKADEIPLAWLIEALTRYQAKDRCDVEGVQLWLRNPQTFYVKYILANQH